jgi:hypothetical protein
MGTESVDVYGTSRARRSIVAACITIALFASAATFLVEGAMRVITLLAAIAIIAATFRGLPDALIKYAARRRGSTYFKTLSFALPIGALLVSIFLGWLLWRIRSSGLLDGFPLDILLWLFVMTSMLNLAVIAINAFASD